MFYFLHYNASGTITGVGTSNMPTAPDLGYLNLKTIQCTADQAREFSRYRVVDGKIELDQAPLAVTNGEAK